ncbi:MAG TPA: hypothetical protein VK749_25520 [Xanthobacteraceae bacterium]|jgi:hypothetical protein|nr:hypothetical protein [Xanthobacteraceae bacterium]
MPDTEEVLTDMGVAQNSTAAAADAQIRPAFLEIVLEITNMVSSLSLCEAPAPAILPGRATAGLIHIKLTTRAILHVFRLKECYLWPHGGHRVAKVDRIDKIGAELSKWRSEAAAMADRCRLKY